jgi:hypothetical protein
MFTKIPSQSSKAGATSNPEINRLLSAAVVSRSFRSMLLNDPAKAIAGGYCGEKFHISSKTAQQATAIHATTLADFATQLAQR